MRSGVVAVSLIVLLAAGGCDERKHLKQSSGSTTPTYERPTSDTSPVATLEVPVRIGENGPNFPACTARGTRRPVADTSKALAVKAAPFDTSRTIGELPPGASFFVCSRSLDEQWFGIVFDAAGSAAPECGVLAQVPTRRNYSGQCRSGWVTSDSVKLAAD